MRTLLVALAVVLILPFAARADGSGDPLGYAPPVKAAPEMTRQERGQSRTPGRNPLALTLADSAPGKTSALTFTGKLTGMFSVTNTNLTNVIPSAGLTLPLPKDDSHKRGAAGEP